MSLLTLMGRGGLAGACGGLLSGLASLVLAEPTVDKAIALEHERAAASGEVQGAELFTRDVQYVGLLIATVLTGLAIGLLFGLVYALLHKQDPEADPWGRSLRLAGAGFIAVSLLPFLRFPANPPGVGDPETVWPRTVVWLAAIAIGLATMAAVGLILKRRSGSAPVRQLAATGVVIAGLAILFVLPGSSAAGDVPADLLWTFRVFSLMTTALIWAGLGIGFGLAGLRWQRALVTQPA